MQKKKKKKSLVPCFKQHILKFEKILCVWCMCVCVYIYIYFKSGNFLTGTIIFLIFIRGVCVREKGGKEKKN